MDKECLWCKTLMENVRADKQYCSRSCAAKAYRERVKNGIDLSQKKCNKCGKDFQIMDTGYTRKYCYECQPKGAYSSGAEMRQLIKKWSLDYKGNKCEKCGYNKCSEALDFHHLNPEEKDFSISDRDIKLDWQLIKIELDKCILVCANCHREIHANKEE